MTETRRLASASLETPINDPEDRNVMPMSTLLASDLWLLETSWDGASIGDVQVYKNAACGQGGARIEGEHDRWVWWGGVPRGKVKAYRFIDEERPQPLTIGLPLDGERKAKPDQAGKGGPKTP